MYAKSIHYFYVLIIYGIYVYKSMIYENVFFVYYVFKRFGGRKMFIVKTNEEIGNYIEKLIAKKFSSKRKFEFSHSICTSYS